MFCTNCGNSISESEHFCTQCGSKHNTHQTKQTAQQKVRATEESGERWWHRLAKVFYIVIHLPLLLIVPLVWIENSSSYVARGIYEDTPALATWYAFLTLVIYLIVVRLIRMTFLYIARAEKPSWKKFFRF